MGVIGSGQMGAWFTSCHRKLVLKVIVESGLGIAYVAALRAKVPVLLHDRSEAQLKKGLAFMDKLLDKDVSKVRTRGRTFISD